MTSVPKLYVIRSEKANFHTDKNHKATAINLVLHGIKSHEKSNKKLNRRLKNYLRFQPVHKSILRNDGKVMS